MAQEPKYTLEDHNTKTAFDLSVKLEMAIKGMNIIGRYEIELAEELTRRLISPRIHPRDQDIGF